jgi:hypothetical protein
MFSFILKNKCDLSRGGMHMHYSPHPLDAHSPKPRRAHADAVTRNVKKFVNNYYYESAAGTMMTNKLFSSSSTLPPFEESAAYLTSNHSSCTLKDPLVPYNSFSADFT